MVIDLKLSNAEVFDVTRFGVKVGEAFTLTADASGNWFANEDPALRYTVSPDGTVGTFLAEAPGNTQVRIFDADDKEAKRLFIEVFTAEAVSADVRKIADEPRA